LVLLAVGTLRVVGCGDVSVTGGSGGAEGECILDAAEQECADLPWESAYVGFTSHGWMNLTSGIVTGVSASTMHIDVDGEVLEFMWAGPNLESKFEIGESVRLVREGGPWGPWEGVTGSSTAALVGTFYSSTGTSPPYTPSLMPPVDLAWAPHCTYGFSSGCAPGCDYTRTKLDVLVTDDSTVTTLAAGDSVELGSGWTLRSQGGEETRVWTIPADGICHIDPSNGGQLTVLGPAP
jgi:hypothetical protein